MRLFVRQPVNRKALAMEVSGLDAPAAETCVCQDAVTDDAWMIECDVCQVWFHLGCVGMDPAESEALAKYHCPRCAPMCGPSLPKSPPPPPGSTQFAEKLFRTSAWMSAETGDALGSRPALLEAKGLAYPPGLDLDRVVRLVGEAQAVHAVDVARQESEQT